MDMKIYVKHIEKRATVDHFIEGEDPHTTVSIDVDIVGIYDSIEDIFKEMGLDYNKDNCIAFDPGRLIYQRMENEHCVTPSESMLELWKEGKYTLFAVEYDIFIDIIKDMHTPTVEEMVKEFGIESYD